MHRRSGHVVSVERVVSIVSVVSVVSVVGVLRVWTVAVHGRWPGLRCAIVVWWWPDCYKDDIIYIMIAHRKA